jgi:hypothetical protein
MLGSLRRSTAGDENRPVFTVRPVRPVKMKVGATPTAVLPAPSIVIEVVDRARVRIPFVEVLDLGHGEGHFPLVLDAVSFSST